MALMIDQELFKVPSDVILMIGIIVKLVASLELFPHRRTSALEEGVNWVLVLAIDIRLGKHFKVRNKPVPRPDMFED